MEVYNHDYDRVRNRVGSACNFDMSEDVEEKSFLNE